MSEIDIGLATKESPEIVKWLVSIGIGLFFSINGLLWFFVKKLFGDKERQIDRMFEELKKDLSIVRELIRETGKATEMTNADTYRRLSDVVSSFEKKSELLNQELHKLDLSVKLAQDKVLLIADVQRDLKNISERAVRLETTMLSMEKIVENFGRVIMKP